jgi:hypothetical protein
MSLSKVEVEISGYNNIRITRDNSDFINDVFKFKTYLKSEGKQITEGAAVIKSGDELKFLLVHSINQYANVE